MVDELISFLTEIEQLEKEASVKDEILKKIAESWPTGKPHVSYSELSNWMECSYRHKLIYIDKHVTFGITPHVILGTGVHASNEKYIETRTMDKSIAKDIISDGWEKNKELFTKGPFPSWSSNGFGKLDDWIVRADKIMNDVPAFLDKQFPNWVYVGSEETLYEKIDNHDLYFKGFIDAVIRVPAKRGSDKYWIIDWKTCGNGWHPNKKRDFKVQLQLVLYKSFWSKKHNVDLKDVRCAFALLKRDGKAGNSVGIVPVSVGSMTETKGLNVINNHVRSVKRGLFLKNREACKFCEFYNTDLCKQSK